MNSKETRLPDFLCIGAQKAATSWLNEILKAHPQVWLPPVKELHYFDHKFIVENRNWTTSHISNGVKQALYWYCKNLGNKNNFGLDYAKYLLSIASDDMFTEEWYKRVYYRPHLKNKMMGDITPEYSTIPLEGVEYVRSFLGKDLKIIYILRDPVSRGLSQFKMNISRSSLDTSNFGENDWEAQLHNHLAVIKNRGDYAKYIPQWEQVFSSDNILYLPYKAIRKDSVSTINKVCQFLGVEQNAITLEHLNKTVHKTKEVNVPSKVNEILREHLDAQYQYMESRFGRDFVSMI